MPRATKHAGDALRDVPPREFVRARNALAARLAKDGNETQAREIRRLPRPSPVVWALNRTAVARPRALHALIETVDRLRRAQLGQGELRTATEGYRAAFETVVRSAEDTLRDASSAVGPALERRISSTLLAAVTDRRLRADLTDGRLAAEHTEPGFAVLTEGPIPAEFLRDRPAQARPAPTPAPEAKGAQPARPQRGAAPSRRVRREEAAVRRRAQQAGRDARYAARRAQRAASALSRDADQKERAAQAAAKRLDVARRTLQTREHQSAVLRAAADAARDAAAKADARAQATTSRTD